jgi:nicotinamide-nucleotide amidase
MLAAILAVGSELLGTERLDTNSLRLTRLLEQHGVELRRKAVVGDAIAEMAAELRLCCERVDLVLVTGGLGPTADDVTREAVAEVLGRGMREDPEVVAAIERRFAHLGWRMPEVNRRQAMILEGAEIIPNGRGTAPGLLLSTAGARGTVHVFLFPGVPAELEGMITSHLEPWLAARSGGVARETAVLKVACLPESEVEERIAAAYEEFGREWITILAKPGEIRLLATAAGSTEERAERLAAMTSRLSGLVGDAVFARCEEDSLEGVVGELLLAAGRPAPQTLTVAESCTGGLLGERLTRVAGSSAYFLGGAITYTDELKVQMLGVPEELLREHGAVSEPVARAMAEGVCRALGSDWGIGITGVAGPGGGSAAKPVGTVHIGLAGPDPAGGRLVTHRKVRFPGDRDRVRWQASQLALELLRRRLLAGAPETPR